MFGIGATEMMVLAFVVVLLFGSTKLPVLAKSLGTAITEFKDSVKPKPQVEKHENGDSNDTDKQA